MNEYIYVIANLNKKDMWMNATPFFEFKYNNKISLKMLSDIFINFLGDEKSIIYFSLYRIKCNRKDLIYKRDELFKNIELSKNIDNIPNYPEKFGFEKINDFEYVVDSLNKKQISNGFEIEFSYSKDKLFNNKTYLAHPQITFNL